MIRWLWELLWPPRCDHNWQYVGEVKRFSLLPNESERPVEIERSWRCAKCGRVDRIKW